MSGAELSGRRRPIASRPLITTEPAWEGRSLPLLVQPAAPDVLLRDWIGANRDQVGTWLLEHGAILFRGFGHCDAPGLGALLRASGADLLDYTERSSPRQAVGDRIFTSTEHPAHSEIVLHCENAYQARWPSRLMFLCRVPAETGGETPLADTRRVRARLDPAFVARVAAQGIMYRRCMDGRLGLPWQEVLGTADPDRAEARAHAGGLSVDWRTDGALRTTAVRRFIDRHPQSGAPIWFNHLLFFHPTSLGPELRKLLASLPPEDWPSDARFGDGSPVPDDAIAALREAHAAETVRFQWQADDVLLLDNHLVAHGRAAFTGRREVLVAMG